MPSFFNSKLGELIASLSKKERDDLAHFIRMPSLGFTIQEQAYFKEILDFKNLKFDSNLSKKEWNYFASKSLKAIYKYLSMSLNPADKMPSGYPLAKHFREKGMTKNYNALTKKLDKNLRLDGYLERTENYYKFLLQHLALEDNRTIKKNQVAFLDYMNAFDNFALENKLRVTCALINQKIFGNLNQDKIPNFPVSLSEHESPVIRIYFHILKMLKKEESDFHFKTIKENVRKNKCLYSPEDRREIYEYLMNYCVLQANHGFDGFGRKYIDLIDTLEAEKLLLIRNQITSSKFNNAVASGISSQKHDWTASFISKYSKKLGPNSKDIVKLSQARLEFHKGNYDAAHTIIINYRPKGFIKKLHLEKLLLKIYYEKGDFKAIERKLGSYKKHLQISPKVPPQQKFILINFCNYLSKLTKGLPLRDEEMENKLALRDYRWFKSKRGNNS